MVLTKQQRKQKVDKTTEKTCNDASNNAKCWHVSHFYSFTEYTEIPFFSILCETIHIAFSALPNLISHDEVPLPDNTIHLFYLRLFVLITCICVKGCLVKWIIYFVSDMLCHRHKCAHFTFYGAKTAITWITEDLSNKTKISIRSIHTIQIQGSCFFIKERDVCVHCFTHSHS